MSECDFTPYIGCKLIKAKPMTRGEFDKYRGLSMSHNHGNPEDAGYLVKYSDDYESWSPADAFEAAYLALEDETKITPAVVDGLVTNSDVSTVKTTTVVMLETRMGFDAMDYSACVAPQNYDESIGFELAAKKAKDKLWMGLGFALAWAKNGLRGTQEREGEKRVT